MTCIIGWVEENKVYMGGDSAGVSGCHIEIRADEKVFVKDNMIFGFTGSYRMGQLIRYSFDIPSRPEGMDDYGYLCSIFVDQLISCFKEHHYARLKENVVEMDWFLLGYHGKLYSVQTNFQVGKVIRNFDATGDGRAYALGALAAFGDRKMNPVIRIRKALEIAAQFTNSVAPPFVVAREGDPRGVKFFDFEKKEIGRSQDV